MADPQKLISLYLLRELTPEQAALLRHWLQQDAEHVRLFVKEAYIHRCIYDFLNGEEGHNQFLLAESEVRAFDTEVSSLSLDDSNALREVVEADYQVMEKQQASIDEQALLEQKSSAGDSIRNGLKIPSRADVFRAVLRIAAVLIVSVSIVWVDRQIWKRSAVVSVALPQPIDVAVLTDQSDALWEPATMNPALGSMIKNVPCQLVEGYAKLTFMNGAEAILQAPVELTLESPEQLYLKNGNITIRVPESTEGFVVRTDTASVVDYGTEFGVTARAFGSTDTYVFEGQVELRSGEDPVFFKKSERLQSGYSGTVDRLGNFSVKLADNMSSRFVRHIPEGDGYGQAGKRLDLADMVGGGNGLGNGRRGYVASLDTGDIIPRFFYGKNGVTDYPKNYDNQVKFVSVRSSPFIDGLFLPDGGAGEVQISDSDIRCQVFPDTSGMSYCDVANGGQIFHEKSRITGLKLGGKVCGTATSPAIYMHANLGVTFDLQTIRDAMPGVEIVRFTAKCGISESIYDDPLFQRNRPPLPSADFWVLVDGDVLFKQNNVKISSGALPIVIELNNTDRYLSLVVTEGFGGAAYDWGLFVEPALELK